MTRPHVLLGVTASIAAHRALDLTSELTKSGMDVSVVMTRNAQEFVRPLAFEALSRRPVRTDFFGPDRAPAHEHIDLAATANLCVIAPASADVIAKLAHGLCDDLLTTVTYAYSGPRIVCPAMNWRMWQNPLTARNLDTLKGLGFDVVDPDSGDLACGEQGPGRLAALPRILDRIRLHLGVGG